MKMQRIPERPFGCEPEINKVYLQAGILTPKEVRQSRFGGSVGVSFAEAEIAFLEIAFAEPLTKAMVRFRHSGDIEAYEAELDALSDEELGVEPIFRTKLNHTPPFPPEDCTPYVRQG